VRIAIDASRTTLAQRTGTENYALQLLRALLPLAQAHQVDLFFRTPPPSDLFPAWPHVRQRVLPLQRGWTHIAWAAALWRGRYAVAWTPAHTLPFFFPRRAVFTAHDLGYLTFPDAHPPHQRAYLDLTTRYSACRATLVMADSQATASDLTHHYHIPPEKIRVVYPGVDERLAPSSFSAIEAVRAKYSLPPRYFLFIGTLQPRKNIARLVQAYALWRSQYKQQTEEVGLVLGGKQGWLFDPTWTEGVAGVQTLGYVAEEDLAPLYSGALAFVFPSLYEGFGFPILEAMLCETPVLCADTSSLPELAEGAALLVNPLHVEAIAQGMHALASDADLRGRLAARGQVQVQRFTWQNAARQALTVLEEAGQV